MLFCVCVATGNSLFDQIFHSLTHSLLRLTESSDNTSEVCDVCTTSVSKCC